MRSSLVSMNSRYFVCCCWFFCFCCCCCYFSGRFVTGWPNKTAEELLLNDVFKGKIDSTVRPGSHNQPVRVFIKYILVSLLNINQREQLLSLNGRIVMKWIRKDITWNLTAYPISYVVTKTQKIWFPHLLILNSADNVLGDIFDHDKFRAKFRNSGLVIYITSGVTTTFCQLDLTYFPFDVQACYLEVSTLSYSEKKIILSTLDDTVVLQPFNSIGQWVVTRAQVGKFIMPIRCDKFSVIKFTFYLKRKPLYHVVTLIIPCTMTSFLVTFAYLLPPCSSEKISLSITTLLAFSVFQLNVSDNTPKTSMYVPIIAIYILFVQFFSALSLMTNIFVIRLNHNNSMTRAPSPLLQRFTFGVLGRLVFYREGHTTEQYIESRLEARQQQTKRRHAEAFRRKSLRLLEIRNLLIQDKKRRLLSDLGKVSASPDETDEARRARVKNLWRRCLGVVMADLARRQNEKTIRLNSRIFACMLRESNRESEEDRRIRGAWSRIVEVFDRFFFVVYVAVDLIACLLIFVVIPMFGPTSVEPIMTVVKPKEGENVTSCGPNSTHNV